MDPLSPLQLRDYALVELKVEANTVFDSTKDQEYEGQFAVNFEFGKQEDAPAYRIELNVDINPSDEAFKRAPYRIRIALQSYFEIDKKLSEDKIPSLLGPNGLAMTYSIARGIVGQATGTSLHGKFLLPTVNFVDLMAKKYAATNQGHKKGKGKK